MSHFGVRSLLLLVLLFLVSLQIKAQTHPCGAGPGQNEVQVGEDAGGNGVAPTPMCNWTNGTQSQWQQRPPIHWEVQWGAVATDGPGGHLGVVTNVSGRGEAERLATVDCKNKGGQGCAVELSYYNQCVAMTVGDENHNVSSAATIDIALRNSLATCSTATRNCHAYYTACSLPKPSL
jgi:hypothetical protein